MMIKTLFRQVFALSLLLLSLNLSAQDFELPYNRQTVFAYDTTTNDIPQSYYASLLGQKLFVLPLIAAEEYGYPWFFKKIPKPEDFECTAYKCTLSNPAYVYEPHEEYSFLTRKAILEQKTLLVKAVRRLRTDDNTFDQLVLELELPDGTIIYYCEPKTQYDFHQAPFLIVGYYDKIAKLYSGERYMVTKDWVCKDFKTGADTKLEPGDILTFQKAIIAKPEDESLGVLGMLALSDKGATFFVAADNIERRYKSSNTSDYNNLLSVKVKERLKINAADYNEIKVGMSQALVAALLGAPGQIELKTEEGNNKKSVIWEYGTNGAYVKFTDDKVEKFRLD